MRLKPLNDLELLEKAAGLASAAGLELYAVGGCVRDWALGRESADIDFLLDGDAVPLVEKLEKEYGGGYRKFKPFLTVRYFDASGRRLDFARFRSETYPSPAALPLVTEASSAGEDMRRRDFTCNAMAVRLNGDDPFLLLDPFGGKADMESGVLRVLHGKSFEDDPTRIYRGARFAGRFGWKLEEGTGTLARAAVEAGRPGLLSRERLRNELVKILSEEDPLPALELLSSLGALRFIHPAFAFGPPVREQKGVERRLGAIAALMGPDGEGFTAGLRLSKKETAAVLSVAAELRRG